MVLSDAGWFNGFSASSVVIFGCTFGLFWIYKGKKTDAKLLSYWGLASIFAGLCFLGNFCDFLTILLTGKNMDDSYGLVGLLGFMWIAPSCVIIMYVGAELIIPEKKWYIASIYLVLGVIFEFFLFLDPAGSIILVYPRKPGEDLIDEIIIYTSPFGIIFIILMTSVLIFCGFGFLYKSIQSTGVFRKKYLLMSLGFIIWLTFGVLESLVTASIALIFMRISMTCSLWLFYFGIKEEPAETKKLSSKKEVKVEDSFFRISKRPDQITEEEVSISKEKKICLVCKGDVSGINYICTECGAFYCMKCSQAIIDLENACWACNAPIDESKPVKPFEREEEKVVVEKEIKKMD